MYVSDQMIVSMSDSKIGVQKKMFSCAVCYEPKIIEDSEEFYEDRTMQQRMWQDIVSVLTPQRLVVLCVNHHEWSVKRNYVSPARETVKDMLLQLLF